MSNISAGLFFLTTRLLWTGCVRTTLRRQVLTTQAAAHTPTATTMRVCARACVCSCTFAAHTSLTAGSWYQQCCLAGLGAAGADLIFVADSACKYVFVRLYCV